MPTPAARPARPARKRRNQYHHGDLRRALLQQALRTIDADGVAGLTLRAVGDALGVSRTALYRHFADKSALLAAVAGEGFRLLRQDLLAAWDLGGRDRAGFEAMGLAYVRFAVSKPAHYRVMFGGFVDAAGVDAQEGEAAFQVLVDALLEQQGAGLIRRDDPQRLASYVWAVVHGVAMLAIDGQLQHQGGDVEALAAYAVHMLRDGIAEPGSLHTPSPPST